MSDQTREYRVVDGIGEVWEASQPLGSLEAAEAWAADLLHAEPLCGPFRVEARTVTDWLETEQPADNATGCQTHGGNP